MSITSLTSLNKWKTCGKTVSLFYYRIDLPFKYALYQMHSFYIELKYHTEDNDLQGLRTFISTNQLEPYLKNIKISF